MNVWILDIDGKIPNLALMRIAAHHRSRGDLVELRRPKTPHDLEVGLWDDLPGAVYASVLFKKSRWMADAVRKRWPKSIIGGTGWDLAVSLEQLRIGPEMDYSIYPGWGPSIGFTQRGCRRRCPWCVTPIKEGKNRSVSTIGEIYRGEPHPKNILLLDQDFFGQPEWDKRLAEASGFSLCFFGGLDCRSMTREQAGALAAAKIMDTNFKNRRVYTAWDRLKDEKQVLRGLSRLIEHFDARSIMVYMLIGFDPNENHATRELRRRPLRDIGVLPYVMPYHRTPELLGYQRWVNYGYDRNGYPWEQWQADGYQAHKHHKRLKAARQIELLDRLN